MSFKQWWAQFKVRLRQSWQHLRNGDLLMDDATREQWAQIQTLVASDVSIAVKRAVEKVSKDKSFNAKQHAVKRSEALGWTGVYLTANYGAPKQLWETNFLIEWHVGKANGKL